MKRAAPSAPAFLSDKSCCTFSATRDESGERVVLLSWHEGEEIPWTAQMELTALDVTRLRDFCDAWLAFVPPHEPSEAA